jgi:hypothetical protein
MNEEIKKHQDRINSVVGLITQRNNKLLGHKKGLKENLFFQSLEWALLESNQPPTDYESVALTE